MKSKLILDPSDTFPLRSPSPSFRYKMIEITIYLFTGVFPAAAVLSMVSTFRAGLARASPILTPSSLCRKNDLVLHASHTEASST